MKKLIIIGMVLVVLSVIIVMVFGSEKSSDELASNNIRIKTIPVKTALLKPKPFAEYLTVTGAVKARNRINVVVEVNGTLKEIKKPKGGYVQRGDTLAVMENEEVRAAYEEAAAALNQARIHYRSSKILYEKRAISENDYLTAKFNLDRAQAQYDLAKARYSKLFITAPNSGWVNDRFQDLGAYLQPPTPLFDLIDNSKVKIIAGVAERFRNDIRVGTPVELTFDAFPDLKIESTVSFVFQSIDPANRTFQIEIEISNPNRQLMPNMVANLKILRRYYADKIAVPVDAIIQSENGRYVFVEDGNKARKNPIQFIAVSEDSVLVDGLQPNQHLIVLGHHKLTDGDSVRIIEE